MQKIAALVYGIVIAVSLPATTYASKLETQQGDKTRYEHTTQCERNAASKKDESHHQQKLKGSGDDRDEKLKPSKSEGHRQQRHRTGRKQYVQRLA